VLASFAQAPAFKHYNHDNGLASNTCYQLFQNARGYIWVATEAGASRFDGLQFRNYSIGNGLVDNEVIAVDEMADSSLLIATYSKGINSIKNNIVSDTVFEYPVGRLNTFLKSKNSIYLQGADGVYIFSKSINKNGKAKLIATLKGLQLKHKAIRFKENFYTVLNGKLMLCKDDRLAIVSTDFVKQISTVASDNYNLYLANQNKVFVLNKNKVIQEVTLELPLQSKVTKMIAFSANNLWLLVDDHILYYYNGKELISVSKYLDLGATRINDILKDNENNIWVSTNGKGVYYLYNFYISNFNAEDILPSNIITSIACKSGEVGFATAEGTAILKTNVFVTNKTTSYNYQICNFNNDWLVASSGKELKSENVNYINSTAIFILKDTQFVANSNSIEVIYNNKVVKKYYFPDSFKSRIQCVLLDVQRNLWVGTTSGLYKCLSKSSLLQQVFKLNKALLGSINSIVQEGSTKFIWIGTNNGLVIINSKDEVKYYTEVGKHIIEQVNQICMVNGNAWLATNRGLHQVNDAIHELNYFDKNTGLKNDNISALAYDSTFNELWVGTDDGVSMLSLANMSMPAITAQPRVEYLETKDSIYVFPNKLFLKKMYPNIKIRFSTPSYTNTKNILYRYAVDGGLYSEGLENEITLGGLGYGKHKLVLQACNANGIWSNPQLFEFEFKTPFWATNWFKIIMGCLLIFCMYLAYKWYRNRIRKHKEEAQKQLQRATTWKQNAILVQQHNHLQIEGFENTRVLQLTDEKHAQLYFTMFNNFNEEYAKFSNELFIGLEEELKLAEQYLELEQVRLPGMFNFSITVDEDLIVQSFKIPNLIIIPFLRNAIWHSLHANSGKIGHVNISVQEGADANLIISISDDGIGPKAAAFFKQKESILQDMEGVSKRLELLSTETLKSTIQITDLTDVQTNDTGTLVILTLRTGTVQNV
jgi:ligand-binding sensor domain-containing protein